MMWGLKVHFCEQLTLSCIHFEPCQLNKTMKIRVMGLGVREISPYHRANPLHNSSPSINLLSFWKFNAAILKPKNSFVLSFPRTGIVSTIYLFRMTDGTVSTPFLIRPIIFRVSGSSSELHFSALIVFMGRSRLATLLPILGLHYFWWGHPSQWQLGSVILSLSRNS